MQPGEKPAGIADKFKMSISQLQEANGVSLKSLGKPGQPLLVLTEGSDLPKGAAPVSEMNENTPVSVPDEDKPSKAASKAKDKAKADKSDKTDKNSKTAKESKSDKPTSKNSKAPTSKSTSSKSSDKPSANTKPATAKPAPAKSTSKSDSKDKSKR